MIKKDFKKNKVLYLMFLPILIWIVMFVLIPFVTNIFISFQDYSPDLGIFKSTIIGFKNYQQFFASGEMGKLVTNTLLLNVLILLIGFPLAVIIAILIYESEFAWLKNLTQTSLFLPFFISSVVAANIFIEFLKHDTGFITNLLVFLGGTRKDYLSDPKYFRIIYTLMDTWQTLGYNVLIYYAALTVIDQTLFEAAKIDGAGKINQIRHITLPGIAPIVIITFLLKIGRIMQLGYEKVLLLQNAGNIQVSEIISTYVYNIGLAPRVGLPNYGIGAAVGIIDAIIALVLIFISNKVSSKLSETKLW